MPQPFIDGGQVEQINVVKNTCYITEDLDDSLEKSGEVLLVWNLSNNIVVASNCTSVGFTDVNRQPLLIEKDGIQQYVGAQGRVLWQQQVHDSGLKRMDVDYMLRGYFVAASKDIEELRNLGGWGHSDNYSKLLTKKMGYGIFIDIVTLGNSVYNNNYAGQGVEVINNTADTVFFEAEDSRLYMKAQAKDSSGHWRDIEYLPRSWCGNSYHKLFLASKEYWDLIMPKYYGGFKTKLRLVLEYKTRIKQKRPRLLYSNEVDVSINPAQFWRKLAYAPHGLADSYRE